jgi:hypothetical protein
MFKTSALCLIASVISMATSNAEGKSPAPRLFELRTYHAMPGKLDDLLTRFRNHTTRLFEKHGMTNVGYWVPVENPDAKLIYLLSYPDRSARDLAWKGFSVDEEWRSVAAASEKDGKIVSKIDQLFLTSTNFSPGFDHLSTAAPHVFEMRTYTASSGNLPALHQRFRNHTLGLFEKHGMTNLAYFQPIADQPAADVTLLYFLAHRDAGSAAKSWNDFRSDPVWLAAKTASETAAGGSLTVPDGVKSVFLNPTDFSPIK